MASPQHFPTSSHLRVVRLRTALINRASQARRWRAQHPLIVDVATVLKGELDVNLLVLEHARRAVGRSDHPLGCDELSGAEAN